MKTPATVALAVGLLATLPAMAAEAPPAGILTGPAEIFAGDTGPVAQTTAPDKSALSILFQSLQVTAPGDGTRSDATHMALRIPLTAGSPTRLTAELRGGITATAGVECRMSLEGPDGRAVLMAREASQAYLKTLLPVAAGDRELKLLISLRCTGKPGTHPTFLATIDSLDLHEAPKPTPKPKPKR